MFANSTRRGFVAGLAAAALVACAPRPGGVAGAPVAEPEAAAAELQSATSPDGPLQVTFSWTLDESGSRIRGRGVARLVAPDRIRLDLFGPRGETYLAAALVDEEFHFPAGTQTDQVALPSPALLWAAVGVVRPPAEARLLDVTTAREQLTARYDVGNGETIEFIAATEPLRLLRASRSAPGAQRETLNLSYGGDGTLSSTRYRNVSAYRELVLAIEAMNEVSPFPSSIWRPDAASR